MRALTKMSLRLLLLCAAAAASAWMATNAADEIEKRGAVSVRKALDSGGLTWASVETDGLLAELSGEAPDEAMRFRAMSLAGTVVNPANLRDDMTVVSADRAPAPDFRLEILRRGSDITVHGLIPGGAQALTVLNDSISAIETDIAISDLVTTNPAAPPEGWPKAVAVGLRAISGLDSSRALITPERVSVSGLMLDPTRAERFRTDMRSAGGPDLDLSLDLRVPRPAVSPFIARFRLDESGGRSDACSADTEAGRDLIATSARNAGIDGPISCTIALGAPDPDWEETVGLGLSALSELGAGTLTVSDLDMTIVPGEQVSPSAVATTAASLEEALPAIYTLDIAAPEPNDSDARDRHVRFTASLMPEGVVDLRGPLPDRRSTGILKSVAAARFSDDNLKLSLRQEAGLPEGWSVRVLAALEAFGSLETGVMTVSPSMIEIVGATGQPDAPENMASGLTETLGPDAAFDLDVTYDAAFDPTAALPTPGECVSRIKAIQARTKIAFGPGETALDAETLKTVRRIADVLKECADATIEIAGYTDSQGREEMNEELSQSRADSVFNALLAERVLTSGLSSKGYGEADPVASNDTATGREENRRIEFKLIKPESGRAGSAADADGGTDTEEAGGQD